METLGGGVHNLTQLPAKDLEAWALSHRIMERMSIPNPWACSQD